MGTFLNVAKDHFPKVTGYDTNNYAVDYGKQHFNLDLRNEVWSSDKSEQYDLIVCLQVLEHLDQPRILFSQLANAAKKGMGLVISVPTLNRNRWKYLLDPDPQKEGTPFFDNDVHITHFSGKGLREIGKQFGATSISNEVAGDIPVVIYEFNSKKSLGFFTRLRRSLLRRWIKVRSATANGGLV